MKDFPWLHREGHMRARIVTETADDVTFDYEHLRVSSWKGRASSPKGMFVRTFVLNQTGAA